MLSMVRRLLGAAFVVGCIALAACQSGGDPSVPTLSGGLGAKVDVPGVPISLESVEGPPESLRGEFALALASEASARRVEIVSAPSAARWRLRGYLTAYPDEEGRTRLAFVWDVFDHAKRRQRRLEGGMVAAGRGSGDPWDAVNRTELQKLASQSMNEIAGFLAANPGAGS